LKMSVVDNIGPCTSNFPLGLGKKISLLLQSRNLSLTGLVHGYISLA
jgi:hypothetical protein